MYGDPSSEQTQQDGTDEGSQYMVLIRNKKIIIKYSLLSRALMSIIFQRETGCQFYSRFSHIKKHMDYLDLTSQVLQVLWTFVWVDCWLIFI